MFFYPLLFYTHLFLFRPALFQYLWEIHDKRPEGWCVSPPILVLRSTSPRHPADKDTWKLGMERTCEVGFCAPAKARLSGAMQSLALRLFEV